MYVQYNTVQYIAPPSNRQGQPAREGGGSNMLFVFLFL